MAALIRRRCHVCRKIATTTRAGRPHCGGSHPRPPVIDEARSAFMRKIKPKDTAPERLLAAGLRRAGLRPKRHDRLRPGTPDFCFPRAKVAVFVDGDFWHGRAGLPRDRRQTRALRAAGWLVLAGRRDHHPGGRRAPPRPQGDPDPMTTPKRTSPSLADVRAAREAVAGRRRGPQRGAKRPKLAPTRTAERRDPLGRPPVLAINTYAGSLLLAAKALGVDILGSYEDSGFGTAHQVANFPELEGLIAEDRAGWPDQDLSAAVVIAHPPCSAFSVQAKGNNVKPVAQGKKTQYGTESDAFACTKDVAAYALAHRARALLVESVPPALEGARAVHDDLAERHGYHVFRVLQNAATFGLPQWRPRFWAVFVRKDLAQRLALVHDPVCVTLRTFLDGQDPGPGDPVMDRLLDYQRQLVAHVPGCFDDPGMLARNLQALAYPDRGLADVSKEFCLSGSDRAEHNNLRAGKPLADTGTARHKGAAFMSKGLRILDPEGTAGVLLRDSWWLYQGRNVTPAEYKAIMGFPRDYRLGEDPRVWLSKGVCPPVAAWLLGEVLRAVTDGPKPELPLTGVTWVEPGATADFRVTREAWEVLAGVTEAPERRRRRPAGDRRAVFAYDLECAVALSAEVLAEAFAPMREVVCPPLRGVEGFRKRNKIARVAVQYEPPTSKGGRGDTDKIVDRVRRILDAAGFGPTVVTLVGPLPHVDPPAPAADGGAA